MSSKSGFDKPLLLASAVAAGVMLLFWTRQRKDGPKIFRLAQIEAAVKGREAEVVRAVAEGFASYSSKGVFVAPVLHLGGEPPMKGKGDVCLKTGFLKNDDYFVVKIASGGFYGNEALNLSPNTGVMMVFSQNSGRLEGLLLDEGILTELRTAAAGCLAAQRLGPKNVQCIGVIGTGIQARYQLRFLSALTCREVCVWGRNPAKALKFKEEMEKEGWRVSVAKTTAELGKKCNLIVTVTNAKEALISVADIRPGTHISCIGADGIGKQEVDPAILAKARVFVDSREQCLEFGETSHAFKAGLIQKASVSEIGEVLSGSMEFTRTDEDITFFDSTGVAVQDVQISKMVYTALTS